MIKFFSFVFLSITSPALLACPNCAGSSNASDQYTMYILAGFIILIYIPFYILFKMAHKHRSENEKP